MAVKVEICSTKIKCLMAKAFKGFNKDLTCRGFQYEAGKTYEEESADLCNRGFHACEKPVDCFNHYAPGESVFREVELEDVSDQRSNDDTKIVGKKITIGAEIGIPEICKLTFEYVKQHCTNEHNAEPGKPAVAGDHEAATAGYRGAATAGYSSRKTGFIKIAVFAMLSVLAILVLKTPEYGFGWSIDIYTQFVCIFLISALAELIVRSLKPIPKSQKQNEESTSDVKLSE